MSYNTLEKKFNEYKSLDEKGKNEFENNLIKREDKKKNKYVRACEEFIYYMLINPRVIKVFDEKKLYFIDSYYRNLAAEISYYYHEYGEIVIADFYTYLNDKKELLGVFNEIQKLDLDSEISDMTIMEYVQVINDYNIKKEIKRLEEEMKKETSDEEKIKILERIRKLKIGE